MRDAQSPSASWRRPCRQAPGGPWCARYHTLPPPPFPGAAKSMQPWGWIHASMEVFNTDGTPHAAAVVQPPTFSALSSSSAAGSTSTARPGRLNEAAVRVRVAWSRRRAARAPAKGSRRSASAGGAAHGPDEEHAGRWRPHARARAQPPTLPHGTATPSRCSMPGERTNPLMPGALRRTQPAYAGLARCDAALRLTGTVSSTWMGRALLVCWRRRCARLRWLSADHVHGAWPHPHAPFQHAVS